LAEALRRTYLPRYDLPVAKAFVVWVSTIAWRLQSLDPRWRAGVAKELALDAIVGQARAVLETRAST
jgi:hypothetical protein